MLSSLRSLCLMGVSSPSIAAMKPISRLISIGGVPDEKPEVSAADVDMVKSLISDNDLFLFMKGYPDDPACGFSANMIQLLNAHGIANEDIPSFNVLSDENIRQAAKDYSEWPTFPQLYIGHEFVGGLDIAFEMMQEDQLEELLKEANVVE